MRRALTAFVLLLALGLAAGQWLAQEQPESKPKAVETTWAKVPAAPLHKELERNRVAVAGRMAQFTVGVEIDYDRPPAEAPILPIPGIPNNADPFFRYDFGPFSGLVVANNQVIISDRCLGEFDDKGASETVVGITVTLPNGVRLPAKVVGRFQQIDLALLETRGDMTTECPGTRVVQFPEGETKLERGQRITVVGRGQNPLGLLVNGGVVSAIGRESKRAFQIDARIGNSTLGAPVVDGSGTLVGLVTLHNHQTFGQASGVSFAAYLHEVRDAYATLKEGKFIQVPPRPFMGVGTEKKWPDKPGLEVGNVVARSGAERAGLRTGDIILQVDGKDMNDSDDLRELITKKKVGDTLKVKYLRGEEENTVDVVLQRAP